MLERELRSGRLLAASGAAPAIFGVCGAVRLMKSLYPESSSAERCSGEM